MDRKISTWIAGVFRSSAPNQELLSWMLDAEQPQKTIDLVLSTIREKLQQKNVHEWETKAFDSFFEELQDSLAAGHIVSASLNVGGITKRKYEVLSNRPRFDSYISSLSLHTEIEVALANLSVRRIHMASNVRLHLSNCNVAHLHVATGHFSELRIENTHVGKLELVPNALHHFEMKDGSLLDIVCPPPGGQNPFTGTVSLVNVFLPRTRDHYLLKGPQPYRNVRYHLRSLENAQMANLFHSAELAVERDDDSWTNRLLSRLYEVVSDFGSSALRPLLWEFMLFLLSMFFVLYSDGAVIVSAETVSGLVGWQTLLSEPTTYGEYSRAAYLAVQPVVNPLGVFGVKSILVPRYPWLAIWLSIHAILGVVLLALLVSAIRRRFKIQ